MVKLLYRWLVMVGALSVLCGAGAAVRETRALDTDWHFAQRDVDGASAVRFDDGSWRKVSLPHAFGSPDGEADGPAIYRGAGWYRRTLDLPAQAAGQRSFIEFDGAALSTDLWVNGVKAGRHEGGFARFRFDVSALLRPGANRIAVRVDSSKQMDVAPLGGDYTLYGGLYRSVRLVSTRDVHIDMADYGSDGVAFHASDVTPARAALNWSVRVTNERSVAAPVALVVRLRDAAHRVVASARANVTVAPGTSTPVTLDATLMQPHLWQGVEAPYLYSTEVDVLADGKLLDQIRIPVGIRSVQFDAARGLLLNGRRYDVHGVNIHQTILAGKGAGVSNADIGDDYRILKELGVTGLRFAHYQHQQHSYDLADRAGYLVYTELPMTSEVHDTPAYQANVTQQLRELIRQNVNHPSVFVWGLGNEIYKVDDVSARLLSSMHALAKQEDPSRPTVYANCCAPVDGPQASHTDVLGSNVYFGWYDGQFGDLEGWADANHAKRPTTPLSISEYGAGGSAKQQEDPPQRPKPGARWHPEQYQALYHEAAWTQLAARPWLWGNFVWVGFDFPSAGRNEGDSPGFNDKGLISFDRKVRKDAFYWYQANWSQAPMLHITSARYTARRVADAEVKVYSNQGTVSLRVNGMDQGTQAVVGHIARWRVTLAPGANRIEARSGALRDTVSWQLQN